jgi:uncharacterized membrane protein (DUF373 family)
MTSKNTLIYFEILIATILFTFTIFSTKETIHISFPSIIGFILYFMIFVELTRALIDFIFESEHKFKVRYIYDMGIIFIIREILVTITSKHNSIESEINFLSFSLIILFVLFILRIIDAKTFNYIHTCSTCSFDYKKEEI